MSDVEQLLRRAAWYFAVRDTAMRAARGARARRDRDQTGAFVAIARAHARHGVRLKLAIKRAAVDAALVARGVRLQ